MILRVEGLELYYGDAQALEGISLVAEEGSWWPSSAPTAPASRA